MGKETYSNKLRTGILIRFFGITFIGGIEALFIYFYKVSNFESGVTLIGTTLGVLVAATTAEYVARNVRHNTEATLLNRTMSYIERWNSPSFDKQDIIRLMREVKEKTSSKEEKENKISSALKDELLLAKLVDIFNFLEEMSLAVEKKAVYEDILRDFFRSISKDYYCNFEHWLDERAKKNPLVYKRFRDLHKRWDGEKLKGLSIQEHTRKLLRLDFKSP